MAKRTPWLLIIGIVVVVGILLWQAGFFAGIGAGPAPDGAGNTYDINVVPGSVTFVGGSPQVAVGSDTTEISGSQATMAAVTSVTLKLSVTHLTGAGQRSFDLTFANPNYVSTGGGSYYLYDRDGQGCPLITMSVDAGGSGAETACVNGAATFHGNIDTNGGTLTISLTFTMQEQLWSGVGGNPPIGFSIDGMVSGTGATDYHIRYTRSS